MMLSFPAPQPFLPHSDLSRLSRLLRLLRTRRTKFLRFCLFLPAHLSSHYFPLCLLLYIGAYGMVVSAVDRHTQQRVAIKKLLLKEQLNLAKRALREVKILARLRHECVVPVLDILAPSDPAKITDVYLVLRLMETDLHKVCLGLSSISEKSRRPTVACIILLPLTPPSSPLLQVIKTLRKQGRLIPAEHTCFWTYQLLRGLKYLHSASVLHRDLKPQNILLNSNSTCDLVVCDFGLSRVLDPEHPPRLSEYVATRWYRAPEVTLTLNQYSSKMDMWSVGCILAEMLAGKPLFQGVNAIDQMQRILDVVGTPSDQDLEWISSESTRAYVKAQHQRPASNLASLFPYAEDLALDLLSQLLQFNPHKRPTAAEALTHPYFVQRNYHNPADEVSWGLCPSFGLVFTFVASILFFWGAAVSLPSTFTYLPQPEAERPLTSEEIDVEGMTLQRIKEKLVEEVHLFRTLVC